jgi:hypothetical protein
MTQADWELYDGLTKALLAQGQRIEELETRVESLLRQTARAAQSRSGRRTCASVSSPPRRRLSVP